MKRSLPIRTLVLTVIGLATSVGCPSNEAPPDRPGQASGPQWRDPNEQAEPDGEPLPTAQDEEDVIEGPSGPIILPIDDPRNGQGDQLSVIRPDAAGSNLVVPPVVSRFWLRERFSAGQRFRRQVRLERSYSLTVQSDLRGTAEGASELTREYLIEVGEAPGGRIQSAVVNVMSDNVRVIPVGTTRPQLSAELGELHGRRAECVRTDTGFECDGQNLEDSEEWVGVFAQYGSLLPSGPTSVGERWELSGDEAADFLGVVGEHLRIEFVLEEDEADYRERTCLRVAYSISGSQVSRVLGEDMDGAVSGTGEYYYCRPPSAVLFHHQERDVHITGTV
ncbi:MAG: hypothetical protein KC561_10875, partial [Myxococcales bacterium]|nr:hypothetical protein [Myxococcales bacterium]